MAKEKKIKSLKKLIKIVKADYQDWDTEAFPWFRGEPSGKKIMPLLPSLYREKHNENRLLQQFRVKSPALGLGTTPPLDRTDQWLFLAQHVRLPTRLLDWTEGLLIALHFAIQHENPVVWMLNPHQLNLLTNNYSKPNAYDLTWLHKPDILATKGDVINLLDPLEKRRKFKQYKGEFGFYNPGNINIKAAWELDRFGTKYPYAILPTYVHPRMSSQKSRFIIWGEDKSSLHEMEGIGEHILQRYEIDPSSIEDIKQDLRMLGVTPTSVFADLDNLAIELKELF